MSYCTEPQTRCYKAPGMSVQTVLVARAADFVGGEAHARSAMNSPGRDRRLRSRRMEAPDGPTGPVRAVPGRRTGGGFHAELARAPAVVLLLACAALLTAPRPAQAQACSVDWCATMTVGYASTVAGTTTIEDFGYLPPSFGALDDDDFAYAGTDYTVTQIYQLKSTISGVLSTNNLTLNTSAPLPDGTVFTVNGTALTVGPGSHNSTVGQESWPLHVLGITLGLVEDEMVAVSLDLPVPQTTCSTPGAIWCATMTVAELQVSTLTTGFGYHRNVGGALSQDEFRYDGTDYSIDFLEITTAANPSLQIEFDPTGETVFGTDDFLLYVDGTPFAFDDAVFLSGQFIWGSSGLSWSDGDMIEVQLVELRDHPGSLQGQPKLVFAANAGASEPAARCLHAPYQLRRWANRPGGITATWSLDVVEPSGGFRNGASFTADDFEITNGQVKTIAGVNYPHQEGTGDVQPFEMVITAVAGGKFKSRSVQVYILNSNRTDHAWHNVCGQTPGETPKRPRMKVADAEAHEAPGATLDFVVTLNRAAPVTMTADYWTYPGTATRGADYLHRYGTLTFAVGESKKTVSVPIIDDSVEDDGETVYFALHNPTGGVAIADDKAVGIIRNTESAGDALTATFGEAPASHDGSTAFVVPVEFSEAVTLTSASPSVSGGTVTGVSDTAGDGTSWDITIEPSGESAVGLTLAVASDCAAAGAICTADGRALSEAVTAAIEGPSASSQTPQVSVADGVVEEGPSAKLGFAITLDRASSETVTVEASTSDGTATAGSDYGAKTLTKTFAPGETRKVAVVTVLDDSLDEGDETLTLTLSSPTNATLGDATATGTITDDDGEAPLPALSVADASVVEGPNAKLAFAITLDRASTETVTVDDGHGGITAIAVTINVTDQSEAPLAPPVPTVTATPDNPTSLDVTWDVPDNDGRPEITSYGLRYRTAADPAWTDGPQGITATSSQITGLSEDTPYLVQVQAINADGAGAWSDSGEGRTAKPSAADPEVSRAYLARIGRMAAVDVVNQVEERIRTRRTAGAQVVVAGRTLRSGVEREIGHDLLRRFRNAAVSDRSDSNAASGANMFELIGLGLGAGDLLTNSSFQVNQETRQGGVLSVWSRGARSEFQGQEGQISLDGRVTSLNAGADFGSGPLLGGMIMSHNRGESDYAGDQMGDMTSSVTSLHPWLGLKAGERVTLWATTGYGAGSLSMTPTVAATTQSGMSMTMAAGGMRGDLVGSGAGAFGLAVKMDALWVNTATEDTGDLTATEATVTRLRTALEASGGYSSGRSLSVQHHVELGMRRDGGDAENGTGMDVAGGLSLSVPSAGLSVNLQARTLLTHEVEGFHERGVSVSLNYDPSPSTPTGPVARITPSWGGQTGSRAGALWNHETMAGLGAGTPPSGGRIDADFGYALPVGSTMVGTPRLGISASGSGRDYRLGYDLSTLQLSALDLQLGIDAHRRDIPGRTAAEHSVQGRLTGSWKIPGLKR